jgi:hypothetical protein
MMKRAETKIESKEEIFQLHISVNIRKLVLVQGTWRRS